MIRRAVCPPSISPPVVVERGRPAIALPEELFDPSLRLVEGAGTSPREADALLERSQLRLEAKLAALQLLHHAPQAIEHLIEAEILLALCIRHR